MHKKKQELCYWEITQFHTITGSSFITQHHNAKDNTVRSCI